MSTQEENNLRISNFFQKNNKKMVNYAFGLTHNMNDAEDIIQDMMIELLTKNNTKIWDENEKENKSLSNNYIMIMIKHRVFNFFDKQKLRVEYDLNENEAIEVDEYDYAKDIQEEELIKLYIETINDTKKLRIDKYASYFIKVRLYKMKMVQAIEIAGVYRNTLYKHFKIMDLWVAEKFQEKKDKYMAELLL